MPRFALLPLPNNTRSQSRRRLLWLQQLGHLRPHARLQLCVGTHGSVTRVNFPKPDSSPN